MPWGEGEAMAGVVSLVLLPVSWAEDTRHKWQSWIVQRLLDLAKIPLSHATNTAFQSRRMR